MLSCARRANQLQELWPIQGNFFFFLATKGGNSAFSVGPYWELMSPNRNVKEEYQSQYQINVVFWGARSWSFTEFQARCKIVSVFQERICFPGSWQMHNGEGAHPFLKDQHAWTQATLHIWAAAIQTQANPSSMHASCFWSFFLHGSNLKTSLENFLSLGLYSFCPTHLT